LKECRIEEEYMTPDHVHMLLSVPPKSSVAEVIGYLKGRAGSGLRASSGMLRILGKGCFVSTVWRDEQMIRAYVRK
jgi:putative transposase